MINNKGLSSAVIITLSVLLVIGATVIVWEFIGPVIKHLRGINTFSPTGNLSSETSGDCTLTEANWNNDSGLEGETLGMSVEGENCEGKEITFRVFEGDSSNGDDDVNLAPSPDKAIFINGKAETVWVAEWQADCNGLCNPPEYFFEASLSEQKIESNLIEIGRTEGDLSPLEDCKTIKYHGDGRVDIVIFAEETIANQYAEHMLSFSPLNENRGAFNFYYIDDYTPDCEIYKGIALLCRSKEMVKRAASCPNDYIMVVESHPSYVRSSAFMNVMSINSNLPPAEVVQHEFGHVFAALAEEYTPAILPKNSKNCVESCDEFNVKDGCYQGCSKGEFYRSIENGVMRTLSSNDFGIFNKKLILERLEDSVSSSVPITGGVILDPSACNQENYYLIEGKYDASTNELDLHKATLQPGCAGTNGYGDVEYTIIEDGDDIIVEGSFNPVYIFSDGIGEEGVNGEIEGDTFVNEKEFYLKIPKPATNGTNLTIYPPQGGGPSGTCFLPDTMIITPSGNKMIKDIKEGDVVVSYNEATGERENNAVTKVFRHQTDSYLIINGKLKVTAEHPMMVNGIWQEIGKARVGDALQTADGQHVVYSIEDVEESVEVFNLEVERDHTYYAEGYLAHNKGPGGLSTHLTVGEDEYIL